MKRLLVSILICIVCCILCAPTEARRRRIRPTLNPPSDCVVLANFRAGGYHDMTGINIASTDTNTSWSQVYRGLDCTNVYVASAGLSYVNYGHDPRLNVTSNMSLIVVVRPSNTLDGQWYANWIAKPGVLGVNDGYGMCYQGPGGAVLPWVEKGGTLSFAYGPGSWAGFTSRFWHLAFVVDCDNGIARTYKNGCQVGTDTSITPAGDASSDDLVVGYCSQEAAGNVTGFGYIIEARVYNRALTAAEVAELWTAAQADWLGY